MQKPRQDDSVQFPTATPLPSPPNRHASILRCLAISAIACFFALPDQSAAQAAQTWTADWAGYILYAPNQVPLQIPNARFTTIEADWIVPDATPTIQCSENWPAEKLDGSSIWIGLDGWSSTYNDFSTGYADTDILQAGTETDIHCDDGNPHSSNAYFWIEWDGLANIPVAPGQDTVAVPVGDTVHVNIAVDTTSNQAWQQATVTFVDKKPNGDINQSYTTTFQSGCLYTWCSPPHELKFAYLFGNTAEWVVESTFYGGKNPNGDPNPNSLNNFTTTQMTNMSVIDTNATVYTPGNPQNYPGNNTSPQLDWMSWTGYADITAQKNVLLACPAITGAQTITLSRAPFAIVLPEQQTNLSPKPTSCN